MFIKQQKEHKLNSSDGKEWYKHGELNTEEPISNEWYKQGKLLIPKQYAISKISKTKSVILQTDTTQGTVNSKISTKGFIDHGMVNEPLQYEIISKNLTHEDALQTVLIIQHQGFQEAVKLWPERFL